MNFSAMAILGLVVCLVGCSSTLGPETLELRYSEQLRRVILPATNENQGKIIVSTAAERQTTSLRPTTPIPEGLVSVKTRTYEVHRPLVDSPSFVGERASAVFQILPGEAIPTRPRAKQIRLWYDSAGQPNLFERGSTVLFWFTASGEFYTAEPLASAHETEPKPVSGG